MNILYNKVGDDMKILIISDIHGDYNTLEKITNDESFDKLIILGDLFNYSMITNDLKDNKIIKLLKKYKNNLILIKGNCDKFINYEKFDLYAHEIFTTNLNHHNVTLTHGNKYKKGFLPSFHGEIFLNGHTHIPELTKEYDTIYANPGSVGSPRSNIGKTYMMFEDNKIVIKTINNTIIKEMEI